MELLSQLGLVGLFLGCFLAATIVPFSSDFLMVGILIAGVNPVLALIVATSGNWLGGLTTYYIGRIGKWNWIEKWFKVKEETLLKQKKNVDRFGSLLAFMTWLPVVGDVFALALGFYRINFTKSALFMLIGKGLRFVFWTLLYYYLGEHVLDFKIL
ncbi:MAG TPA: YqaA family protein [Bacteroidales bacterium]|jgi:membrane protein YqaA with SNARE-associated domain|nr:YqaA family protein [Bacteroidales bacterium]